MALFACINGHSDPIQRKFSVYSYLLVQKLTKALYQKATNISSLNPIKAEITVHKAYFFAFDQQSRMFTVYLIVDFLLLFVDNMKTLLNTHPFAPCMLWQRIMSRFGTRVSAGLILLLIVSFANQALAAGFSSNYVVISSVVGTGGSGGVNGNYYTTLGSSTPKFTSISNLGTFDRGSGTLTLGAESNTTESGTENVNGVQVFYRVYLDDGTTAAAFTSASPALQLTQTSVSNKTRQFNSVGPVNILSATTGAGNYKVDFFFRLNGTTKSGNSTNPLIFDDSNNGSFYTGKFTVIGSVPAIWNGGLNSSWFNQANWSPQTVPTAKTDVTIPYTDANGVKLKNFPTISSNTAYVRTLTILGNNTATGAVINLYGGELQVFGDFKDANAGMNATGGIFTLAGGNQTFDGDRFYNFNIQGGGTKTLTGVLNIVTNLTFVTSGAGGIISTRTDNQNSYGVNLLPPNATISNEDENSYVLGVLNSSRDIGNFSNFGGIGVDLTVAGGVSSVSVTRITGISYTGVGLKGSSVQRSFTFYPDNSTGLNYTLAFHYLTGELNGNDASNLAFYVSPPNVSTFTLLGRGTNNPGAKTSTLTQITTTLNSAFTLGEVVPLPVTLISFTATATAQGAALLRWATATESNNRGFGIERQLGANEAWQSVGFVAAGATTGSTYEFTDKSLVNAPASAQAYYRLRQEDLNGKVTYSPVAAINRTAAVAATELTLSPVPVSGTDNLSVGLAEAGQAGIMVAVINTQGQRLMSFTTEASTDGALSLPVTSLAAGVYIVTVQVPGQAARHARFVKL